MFGKKKHEFDGISFGAAVEALANVVADFAGENHRLFEKIKGAMDTMVEMMSALNEQLGEVRSQVVKAAKLETLRIECQQELAKYEALEERFGPSDETEAKMAELCSDK